MRATTTACLLAALIMLSGCMAVPRQVAAPVRIGAPDDTAGMLVDYVVRAGGAPSASVVQLETLELRDCCGAKSQTALAAEDVDLAVLCPDAAAALVKRDARFVVVGPVAANTDVVVLRKDGANGLIGYTQNREYQREVIAQVVGKHAVATPMLTESLPYALEKGSVEGVVTDFVKARAVAGRRLSSANPGGQDRVTYVLVTSKAFREDKRFPQVISAFDDAARALTERQTLRQQLGSFTGVSASEKEVSEWVALKVRLLPVSKTRN